jgi:mRNA interferase MazF
MCPVTSQQKGYPFEVELPASLTIRGSILADHLKSVDWRERDAAFIGRVPPEVLRAVLNRIAPLLGF